jgi:hypothetical protein
MIATSSAPVEFRIREFINFGIWKKAILDLHNEMGDGADKLAIK